MSERVIDLISITDNISALVKRSEAYLTNIKFAIFRREITW